MTRCSTERERRTDVRRAGDGGQVRRWTARAVTKSNAVDQPSSADPLSAGALAVLTPWPAAGPTLAVLQPLLGPADAASSCRRLLGILDPADELVAGQRCDVLPGIECGGVGDQRLPEVCWKLVHHPTRHSRGAHRAHRSGRKGACSRSASGTKRGPAPARSIGQRPRGWWSCAERIANSLRVTITLTIKLGDAPWTVWTTQRRWTSGPGTTASVVRIGRRSTDS